MTISEHLRERLLATLQACNDENLSYEMAADYILAVVRSDIQTAAPPGVIPDEIDGEIWCAITSAIEDARTHGRDTDANRLADDAMQTLRPILAGLLAPARAERDALERIVALTFDSPLDPPLPEGATYTERAASVRYNIIIRVNRIASAALAATDREVPHAE